MAQVRLYITKLFFKRKLMKQLITNLTMAFCCLFATMSIYAQCDGEYIAGFIYMGEHDGSHYYCSSHNNYTWSNANAAAQAAGGHLVVINDAAENEYIRSNIMANSAWIGYTDEAVEDNFVWVGDNSTYENWQSGEPNNYGGNEDYARIRKHSGKWTDRGTWHKFEFVMEMPCSDPDPVGPAGCDYVCEVICANVDTIPCIDTLFVDIVRVVTLPNGTTIDIMETVNAGIIDQPIAPELTCSGSSSSDSGSSDPVCTETEIPGFIYIGEFNGSNYYCSASSTYTWEESNQLSQDNGGHLVVINDAAENDFISDAIMASSAWIGFTDEALEDEFVWTNGDPVTYTNWQSGQPNNLYGAEHYTRIKKYSGEWTDRTNDYFYEFVMEVPCEPATAPPTTCDPASNIVITQTEGPMFGDTVAVGTYTVTYTIVDTTGTGIDTTCTFPITIACSGGGNRIDNSLTAGFTTLSVVKATPNPTKDNVQLSFVSEYTMEGVITVYSSVGEPVNSLTTTVNKGHNTQTIDLSEFPAGLYYVDVQMRGENKSVKVIKTK